MKVLFKQHSVFLLWLLLFVIPLTALGQDTLSQDLSKQMEQEEKQLNKHPPVSSPFRGDGMGGSGGHCAGNLLIKHKTLTWDTVYSECDDVPYKTLIFKQHADDLHAVYLLQTKDPKCGFKILVLDHTRHYSESRGKGWNVTGYGSWKGYRTDDIGDQLSCHLY
jgi:hypothetical protein